VWSHVVFEHPKTFATLAMDPASKKEVMDDLDAFRNGRDYYARVGKAWKRGYLLYGPPGTGKSTMIAAMANYLDYDVYDIELTSVRTNTDLRKLFIETTGKSIIVIEDIDCSLDLTGKRKKKKKDKASEESDAQNNKDGDKKDARDDEKDDKSGSKVTLSGVLNFIDGLWSACGGERIIVFTTNHIEKLDPALIRRGRMDKHIEMSYCCFEAFKFLAKIYLDVDSHRLFDVVEALLREVDVTPADVAENLTPKAPGEDADSCLAALVEALEKAKEEALAKKEKAKGKEAAEDAESDSDDE
jgi:SpoVK/Ycf46/Vps4 family AAA+-type ATPase